MLDRLTWRIGFIAAAVLAALLFVGFATQTIRIEGFNLWPLRMEGFKDANKRLTLDLDNIKDATERADQAARLAKAKTEQEYRERAERTDDRYKAQLADARARAADYARRMRVHAPGSPSGPATPADSGGAEGADRSGEGTFVAVSRPDFDILTENTERLKAAHDWACGLEGAECVDKPR